MENKVISREYVEKNYIHKDKIRELLKTDTVEIYGIEVMFLDGIEKLLEDKELKQ